MCFFSGEEEWHIVHPTELHTNTYYFPTGFDWRKHAWCAVFTQYQKRSKMRKKREKMETCAQNRKVEEKTELMNVWALGKRNFLQIHAAMVKLYAFLSLLNIPDQLKPH